MIRSATDLSKDDIATSIRRHRTAALMAFGVFVVCLKLHMLAIGVVEREKVFHRGQLWDWAGC